MVNTRTARSGVQATSKNVCLAKAPKTNGLASTSRPERKAIQEPEEKLAPVTNGNDKKRSKKSVLPYLPDPENDPNENVRLPNLPRELFDHITSFLEPDALTCLSLTCKQLLKIVGRKSWTECHSKRQSYNQTQRCWINFRYTLIPLLARDAPHLIFCGPCMALHPPLKSPRERQETKLSTQCFGPWSSIDYLPHDENGRYNLVWEHIAEARKSLNPDCEEKIGPPIELLAGNFTMHHKRLNYTLISTGRQIKKNLVLKHEHIFQGVDTLRLADIMALPVRLCPHQTTSTQKPEPSRYTKGRLPSGLLTHSITAAAPSALWKGVPLPNRFNLPAPSEQNQMDSTIDGEKLWTCRACPTKWHVQYCGTGAGKLKITAWHSFGDTAYRAQEYWKMLVRREVSNLGADKRNSEFFVSTRQYLDFEVDNED